MKTVISKVASAEYDALGGFFAVKSPQEGYPKTVYRFRGDVSPSEAAASAVSRVCREADISLGEIDYFISCTQTPDFNNPGLVSCLLSRLKRSGVPGLELKLQSAGALFGLDAADVLIKSGAAKRILLVATDFMSRYAARYSNEGNMPDRARLAHETFGDGAEAIIIESREDGVSNGYEYQIGKILTIPAKVPPFCAPIPCASQFPLRITLEDIQEGRDVPAIDIASTRKIDPVFEEALNGCLKDSEEVHAICTHALFPGQRMGLFKKLAESKYFDLYDRFGHIGSAGVLGALREYGGRSGESVILAAHAGSNLGISKVMVY